MPISYQTHIQMLRMVGGCAMKAPNGEFVAVFKRSYSPASGGEVDVEERSPTLVCTTHDVDRLQVQKDTPIEVGGVQYRVRMHEPDGEGESILYLRS